MAETLRKICKYFFFGNGLFFWEIRTKTFFFFFLSRLEKFLWKKTLVPCVFGPWPWPREVDPWPRIFFVSLAVKVVSSTTPLIYIPACTSEN